MDTRLLQASFSVQHPHPNHTPPHYNWTRKVKLQPEPGSFIAQDGEGDLGNQEQEVPEEEVEEEEEEEEGYWGTGGRGKDFKGQKRGRGRRKEERRQQRQSRDG